MDTIADLMARGDDDATAISAPGRAPLGYGALRRQIAGTALALGALGIGRNDAVAMVLPNGPEMASAFVAVAGAATAAPLNPAYKTDEFDFYLSDLDARAVIIAADMDTPARDVAARRHIPVIDLEVDSGAAAGEFTLEPGTGAGDAEARAPGAADGDDIALVLHTSGTTSRPKIVPLSQRNVCASAQNVAATLELGPDDLCLNIMPLFHIHGLIASVLASFAAGAGICCTPGFNALRFAGWLAEVGPSWYTAVPTMHQAILARAGRDRARARASGLRFIRSSSASLAPQIMAALEDSFGCPVIEAYGMTEAAHQMASNPLPPAPRKPGTVGLAAGPEVAIMGEGGALLGPGAVGEIVIRGDNVTAGYQNNPGANAEAFADGWFRTGDQGMTDAAGYLTITGRLKEIINRGGEKISPREVDEILMDHPAVVQAVTFALPHDKLGEDVAAAVVLGPDGGADEAEIRRFAGERLARFKVPGRVVIVDEIPTGATGKLQRIGLAEKLGLV